MKAGLVCEFLEGRGLGGKLGRILGPHFELPSEMLPIVAAIGVLVDDYRRHQREKAAVIKAKAWEDLPQLGEAADQLLRALAPLLDALPPSPHYGAAALIAGLEASPGNPGRWRPAPPRP